MDANQWTVIMHAARGGHVDVLKFYFMRLPVSERYDETVWESLLKAGSHLSVLNGLERNPCLDFLIHERPITSVSFLAEVRLHQSVPPPFPTCPHLNLTPSFRFRSYIGHLPSSDVLVRTYRDTLQALSFSG